MRSPVRLISSTPEGVGLRRWADPLLDLVFPALCPVCEGRCDEPRARPFCRRCWGELPLLPPPGCSSCGGDYPGVPAGSLCDRCRRAPRAFRYLRAVARYEAGMRAAIVALKYRGRTALARPLGRLLAEAGPRLLPAPVEAAPPGRRVGGVDAIVPIPLHRSRLAERGFNQAELLARPAARAWGVPLLARALARSRATRPQMELDELARRGNVAGAFQVVRPHEVAGRRVLLVDDVLTTGATAAAAAEALRRAGAASVGVLVLARVPDR